MKILINIDDNKYKALKKFAECGAELGYECRAILDGEVVDDKKVDIPPSGQRLRVKGGKPYIEICARLGDKSDLAWNLIFGVLHKGVGIRTFHTDLESGVALLVPLELYEDLYNATKGESDNEN